MAIAYDNSNIKGETDGDSSVETSSWTIAGANRFLAAFIASGAGSPLDPSGMKWGGSGGTTLTQEGSAVVVGTFAKLSQFSLVAPAASNLTLYGSFPGGQDEAADCGASYTGVDQVSPLRTSPTPVTGESTSPSITATTVAGDVMVGCLWVLDLANSSATITSNGSQNSRQVLEGGTPFSAEAMALDDKTASGTSTTLSWTISINAFWVAMAYVLKPDSGGGGDVLMPQCCF